MSAKATVSISVCLLLVVSICVFVQAPAAHSWAWGTHHFITQNAIDAMPGSLSWFFSAYSDKIQNYCIMPDVWRDQGNAFEGYRHYYDSDIPHGEGAVLVPENYLGKEILVYQEDAIPGYSNGILPWNLVDNFNMLVVCLEENYWDNAAQLMGVIAHYTEDASMPLHATSYYNPGGNHTAYEGQVDSEVSLENVTDDLSGFTPYVLTVDKQMVDGAVFDSVMQELADSYSHTAAINSSAYARSAVDNHTDILSYYLAFNMLWNNDVKNITDNRMPVATKELSNIWLTAFNAAGLYNAQSTPPSNNTRDYPLAIAVGVLVLAVIGIITVVYIKRH